MSEQPVIEYLQWQVEQHDKKLHQLYEDISPIKDGGAIEIDHMFADLTQMRVEAKLAEFRRIYDQRYMLAREILRLQGAPDFYHADNYLV